MEKKDYCYCRRENGKDENVSTTISLFTAGVVLLMVCLKRASMLFLFEQQWRVAWVFLVLNIVVLAIYFTSMNPNLTQISNQESKEGDDEEEMMKMKRGNCNEVDEEMMKMKRGNCNEVDEEIMKMKRGNCNEVEACKEGDQIKVEEDEVMVLEENVETLKLSKEELNERVEAFITMFRKHLALDARKGRDDKFYVDKQQAHHINHSSHQVDNCFVLKVQG